VSGSLDTHTQTHTHTHTHTQTHTQTHTHTYTHTHTHTHTRLPKDFRVINIQPPRAQVFDTVDLYRLPNQRKLSLKYLVFKVLGVHMQQSGSHGHDSIEDSIAALRLFER
jgi:hypothetical protein